MFARPTLGAYPDQAYFDRNRPSWVPYWIDTPTETQAKYAWLVGQTATAQQIVNPGAVYPPPPMPPAVKPPADIVTPPANKAQAEQTISDVLARQMREWQAANQGFYNTLAPKLEPDAGPPWVWIAAAVGAVSLIAIWRN